MDPSVTNIKSVRDKIIAQAQGLIANGIDVTIVIGQEDERVSREMKQTNNIRTIYLNKVTKNKYLGYFTDFADLMRFTMSLNENDILYTRYSPFSLFIVPRNCTIITEHQTKESMEYKSNSFLPFMMERCFGKLNRRMRDYYVAVTGEISDFESQYGEAGHIVIPNGISLQNIPVITRKAAVGEEFHVVGLANVSLWHGYDRMIEGLNRYSGPVKVYFHIIGEGLELPNLRLLAKKYGLEERVIFHGHMRGNELNSIMDNYHIAIGALGIHRIGIREAATLKSREYCSRGIPFIEDTIDGDFKDFPYRYQIEPEESPIDVGKLIEFFNGFASDDYPRKMREYAEQNLTWESKMKVLKTFLTEIRSKNGSS